MNDDNTSTQWSVSQLSITVNYEPAKLKTFSVFAVNNEGIESEPVLLHFTTPDMSKK